MVVSFLPLSWAELSWVEAHPRLLPWTHHMHKRPLNWLQRLNLLAQAA